MTKKAWEEYRKTLNVSTGMMVNVDWHWNYGSTVAKQNKTAMGRLEFISEKGIELGEHRIGYRCLEAIRPYVEEKK